MAFLTGLVSGARSLLGGNPHEVQPAPKDPAEVFKGHLSEFSEMSISEDECIENCIKSVRDLLWPVDCDLSATSLQTIQFHLENFNKAVGDSSYLGVDDAEELKAAFKKSLYTVVEQKWAEHMATSFYHILSLADNEEQSSAVQQWTHHYFTAADDLNEWGGSHTYLQGTFVARLECRTRTAFRAYSQDMILKKMEIMHSRAEKDPISFDKRMEEVMAKQDKDPTSLSPSEKEYVAFVQNLASCVTRHWPDIDKKVELLKTCIWRGYTLRTVDLPILKSDSTPGFFAGAFKKV